MKTYYYIPNIWEHDDLKIENAYDFKSTCDIYSARLHEGYDELELEWLVEDMAKDYIYNHDGWEIAGSWHGNEREFVVWDSNKNFVGKFDVLLEYEPIFHARRKK